VSSLSNATRWRDVAICQAIAMYRVTWQCVESTHGAMYAMYAMYAMESTHRCQHSMRSTHRCHPHRCTHSVPAVHDQSFSARLRFRVCACVCVHARVLARSRQACHGEACIFEIRVYLSRSRRELHVSCLISHLSTALLCVHAFTQKETVTRQHSSRGCKLKGQKK